MTGAYVISCMHLDNLSAKTELTSCWYGATGSSILVSTWHTLTRAIWLVLKEKKMLFTPAND